MAITIASISESGGNTIVTINLDGNFVSDPVSEFGIGPGYIFMYSDQVLQVQSAGTPNTADITLTGTWDTPPDVGDEVAVEAAVTIASISESGGNTVITINYGGQLIEDPAGVGLTAGATIAYGGVPLTVSAVGSPTTADISLTGTWASPPGIGDVVEVGGGGGGGGGGSPSHTSGNYTVTGFSYDSEYGNTSIKLDNFILEVGDVISFGGSDYTITSASGSPDGWGYFSGAMSPEPVVNVDQVYVTIASEAGGGGGGGGGKPSKPEGVAKAIKPVDVPKATKPVDVPKATKPEGVAKPVKP